VGIPWKKKIQGLAMKSCSKECRWQWVTQDKHQDRR
jgi:hypothetical protein